MHDVYIVDEEFEDAAKIVTEVCGEIDRLFERYLSILAGVSKGGLVEGKAAEAFDAFAQCAEKLRGHAAKLAISHQTVNSQFLTQVDVTDSYLYD